VPSELDPSSALPTVAQRGAWPRTFTDDLGAQVTLERAPERVVSVAPDLTEIIFAIGEGQRLVGVSDFCDYPPEAADKEKVGNLTGPSVETILSLQPDLVLVVRGVSSEVIDSLRAAGIKVVGKDPGSLAEVIEMVREVGRMLGGESAAGKLAGEMAARRRQVEERAAEYVRRQGRPRVLFLISLEPVFVAGPGSFANDLIRLAGGQNVVGEGGEEVNRPWPQYSLEKIVAQDPDLIIAALDGHTEQAGSLAERMSKDPGWQGLKAVQQGRVHEVDPDLFLRVGPRLLDGLEELADIVLSDGGRTGEE